MSQGYFDAFVNRIGKEAVNFAHVDEWNSKKKTSESKPPKKTR